LVGTDEDGTLARLRALFREVVQPAMSTHHGRVFKLMGDAFLAEFPSAVEAVHCAAAVQEAVRARELSLAPERRIRLRVGVHLGDVVAEGGDLLGDGVNLAARLEGVAEPGEVVVSATVAETVRGRVPFALEDLGERALKNIERPVRAFRLHVAATSAEVPAPVECPRLPLPDRPSLVVLPFQNMSGDPEQEYLADGIAEELTTALSRVRWFFVIARNSAFTYKGRAADVRQVGRELGVRYALEGSVRKAGDRLRITVQLVEAEAGRHVWAERFDGDLAEIFALQDRVAEAVAGAIEPSLRAAEVARARAKPTESLDAYDLYLRALPHRYARTSEGGEEALVLLRRAAALDPGFALAKALAAFCHTFRVVQGWEAPGDREEGLRLAREAVACDRDEPATLHCAARALVYLGFDHGAALAAVQRALALNPNSAEVQNTAGLVHNFLCRPTAAIEHFERAIRLSPLDPEMADFFVGFSIAYSMAGRHEEALEFAKNALHEMPNWAVGHRQAITVLSSLGRREEAAAAALRFRQAAPAAARVFADHWRRLYGDQGYAETRIRALREAGLPE
jgi:adenylate cyclase